MQHKPKYYTHTRDMTPIISTIFSKLPQYQSYPWTMCPITSRKGFAFLFLIFIFNYKTVTNTK